MKNCAILVVVLVALSAHAQSSRDDIQRAQARLSEEIRTAKRALATELEKNPADYRRDQGAATEKIEALINEYLEHSEVQIDNLGAIRADLAELSAPAYNLLPMDGVNTEPFVEAVQVGSQHFMITQYTLMGAARGAPDSNTVIAAYLVQGHVLHLKSRLVPDFDGYAITVRPVEPPVSGQFWFLAYGPKFGYNGTLVRMRLYAFDGRRWRVVWIPEDRLNAEIEAAGNKIFVTHLDAHQYYDLRKAPVMRHDTYLISAERVRLLNSELGPE